MTKFIDRSMNRRHLMALGAGAAALAQSGAAAAAAASAAETAALKMNKGYAPGPFGHVHYWDTGGGKPVVLIHQAPVSLRQFEAVYPLFHARGYRAIGIDMPGFGESDATSFVPRIEDWAKTIPAVLDHLKIARADAVGFHTGGEVATEFTLQFPNRARKLVMHSAIMSSPEERAARLKRVEETEKNFVYKEDGSHLTDVYNGRFKMWGEPKPDPKVITRLVVERFMGTGESWWGHWAAYQYDHQTALTKVKVPAMVITNTEDVIREMAVRAKALRPDFVFAEIQGGGGADAVDKTSEAWTNAIVDFLNA